MIPPNDELWISLSRPMLRGEAIVDGRHDLVRGGERDGDAMFTGDDGAKVGEEAGLLHRCDLRVVQHLSDDGGEPLVAFA